LCLTITKTLWSLRFNFDYEREKKNNKNTLVFQQLVQDTFILTETDDEEIKKFPNKVIKRRDESMETET
jgi:hypothetical protein